MKRRQYLSRAGVSTFLGVSLGGCSGNNDEPDDGGDSGGGGNGTPALNACPMVPGSFTQFDPGDGPLPYSFEHPDIVPVEYAREGPDTLATLTSGVFERSTDDELSAKGSISLGTGINAASEVPPASVDRFYDERSNHETLLTTPINGEAVRFVGEFPEPGSGSEFTTSFSEDRNSYQVIAFAPYKWESRTGNERAFYHQLRMSVDIQLPETEVTSSCAGNLLETLRMSVESIEMSRNVEPFEERVNYSPP